MRDQSPSSYLLSPSRSSYLLRWHLARYFFSNHRATLKGLPKRRSLFPQVFEREMESIQKEVVALASQNSQLSEEVGKARSDVATAEESLTTMFNELQAEKGERRRVEDTVEELEERLR